MTQRTDRVDDDPVHPPVSKGFEVGEDSERGINKFDNELQMRAYWTEYDRRMNGHGAAP